MPSIYKLDYPGAVDMQCFDAQVELKRWFDNWKLDRNAAFAGEYEWLTVEEKKFTVGRRERSRFIGHIGDVDSSGIRRNVLFEVGAPAPPTFYRPAKFRPKPKPKPTRYAADGLMGLEELAYTMDKLALSAREQRDLVMRSRSPWDLQDILRRIRIEREWSRLDAMRWALPVMQNDRLIVDFDLPKPRVPPPPQFRRN